MAGMVFIPILPACVLSNFTRIFCCRQDGSPWEARPDSAWFKTCLVKYLLFCPDQKGPIFWLVVGLSKSWPCPPPAPPVTNAHNSSRNVKAKRKHCGHKICWQKEISRLLKSATERPSYLRYTCACDKFDTYGVWPWANMLRCLWQISGKMLVTNLRLVGKF